MGLIRNVVLRLVPARLGAAMEAESRLWTLRCQCGQETSLWDAGGLRYRGTRRRKRTLHRCPRCERVRWAELYHKDAPAETRDDRGGGVS